MSRGDDEISVPSPATPATISSASDSAQIRQSTKTCCLQQPLAQDEGVLRADRDDQRGAEEETGNGGGEDCCGHGGLMPGRKAERNGPRQRPGHGARLQSRRADCARTRPAMGGCRANAVTTKTASAARCSAPPASARALPATTGSCSSGPVLSALLTLSDTGIASKKSGSAGLNRSATSRGSWLTQSSQREKSCGLDHHRHAVVDVPDRGVGVRGQDGAGVDLGAARLGPGLHQPGKGDRLAVARPHPIGLRPVGAVAPPFVEAGGRDQRAAMAHRRLERRLVGRRFGARVEQRRQLGGFLTQPGISPQRTSSARRSGRLEPGSRRGPAITSRIGCVGAML